MCNFLGPNCSNTPISYTTKTYGFNSLTTLYIGEMEEGTYILVSQLVLGSSETQYYTRSKSN